MSGRVTALLAMLERGQDSSLLRFSLGNEYLAVEDYAAAAEHFASAVAQDQQYSAAWKLLGKSLAAAGHLEQAFTAFAEGITVAEANGDKQAVKEMRVFQRRLEKKAVDAGDDE